MSASRLPLRNAGRHGRRAAFVAWIGAVVLLLVAGPAIAQTAGSEPAPAGPSKLVVRSIDATAYPDVAMTVYGSGAPLQAGSITVTQQGLPVDNLVASRLADTAVPVGVVFVVDGSAAMRDDGAIDRVKAQLIAMAATKPADQQWGLVQYTARSRTVLKLTTSADEFVQAVSTLGTSSRQESAMREGISMALDMFSADPTLQRNLVVVNGSQDAVSIPTLGQLEATMLTRNVVVTGVNVQTDLLAADELAYLASSTSGDAPTVSTKELAAALETATRTIAEQYVVTFRGPEGAALADVVVTAGSTSTTATVTVGARAEGASLRVTKAEPILGSGPEFLQTSTGKIVGIGLGLLAAALFVWAVATVFVRDRSSLQSVLQPYSEPQAADLTDGVEGGMSETKLVQRAVEITGQLAERRGLVSSIEAKLEQADLPLRAAEAIFFAFAGTILLTLLTFLATGSPFRSLIVLLVLALLPPAYLNLRVARRRKKFVAQLPDTLNLLAGSLKAGYSLMQGVEAVSQEVEDPMGRELKRIVVEARLGRAVEDALEDAAKRVQSPDFGWAIMAIRIQREVGGNLAELLLTVSDTMQQRERLRRDVKSLTAEGRMSAIVLGILPIALGFVMNAVNGEYMQVLFTETIGRMMLVMATIMIVVGFYWMKKTVEVDV